MLDNHRWCGRACPPKVAGYQHAWTSHDITTTMSMTSSKHGNSKWLPLLFFHSPKRCRVSLAYPSLPFINQPFNSSAERQTHQPNAQSLISSFNRFTSSSAKFRSALAPRQLRLAHARSEAIIDWSTENGEFPLGYNFRTTKGDPCSNLRLSAVFVPSMITSVFSVWSSLVRNCHFIILGMHCHCLRQNHWNHASLECQYFEPLLHLKISDCIHGCCSAADHGNSVSGPWTCPSLWNFYSNCSMQAATLYNTCAIEGGNLHRLHLNSWHCHPRTNHWPWTRPQLVPAFAGGLSCGLEGPRWGNPGP